MDLQNLQTLGVPKEEFLAHVRRSLGRPEGAASAPKNLRLEEPVTHLVAQAEATKERLQEHSTEIADKFAETAQLRSWNVFRTADSEEAVGYVVGLCQSNGIDKVARSDQTVFAQLPLDSALQSAGIEAVTVARDDYNSRESLRREIVGSGLGITGADYAVAETGSVVVIPRKGLSRLVSLVPPVHVAIVRHADLVESLDDVFLFQRLAYHQNGGDMGSYLNFITGPSRTADIEMKLVVGVHGPREVHLVLLDQ